MSEEKPKQGPLKKRRVFLKTFSGRQCKTVDPKTGITTLLGTGMFFASRDEAQLWINDMNRLIVSIMQVESLKTGEHMALTQTVKNKFKQEYHKKLLKTLAIAANVKAKYGICRFTTPTIVWLRAHERDAGIPPKLSQFMEEGDTGGS